MRRRLVIAGMAAALALPAPALAQEEPAGGEGRTLQEATERLRARLGPEAADRLRTIVDRAAERGAPADPLLDKALEGAAKGVPADRIAPALETFARRLERSAGLVGRPAGPDAVVAGADALSRGVPAEEVRRVARSAPAGGRAVPLVVLGDLVEAGVPARSAADVVREAVRGGRSQQELLRIPARVRRMIRQGVPPSRAAGRAPGPPGRAGPPADVPAGGGPGSGAGGGPPVPPGSGPPGSGPPDDPGGSSGGPGGGGGTSTAG